MREAADALEFERAARLRDRLDDACSKAIERQQMVADRNEDLDVIGLADDDLEAAVQVFYVRKGRVVGPQGLRRRQGRGPHRRRARRPDPRGPVRRGAAARRAEAGAGAGRARRPRPLRGVADASCAARACTMRVPQRGDKRALHETVTRNAKEEFTRHRLRRASDHNSRARALNELQDPSACPRRRCASSATT